MNPEKARLKLLFGQSLGADFDDMREAALHEKHANMGARDSLAEVGERIADLAAHVDKDLNETTLPSDPLEVAAYAKRYITRAVGVVHNLAKSAGKQVFVADGKVAQADRVIKHMKKLLDDEETKLEDMKATPKLGVIEGGKKPGVSAAQDIQNRRDAAKKQKATKQAAATKKPKKVKKSRRKPKTTNGVGTTA